MKKSVLFGSLILLSSLFFTGCQKIKGYSILLWNLPEYELQDSDIVPVFIKSNISNVYVIGTGNGKHKAEIPLWQITDPVSKHKAKKLTSRYAEYRHTYASVALDGLPMRAEPVNTAKQVYRLRKNETIKILYKGKGQAVYAGKKPLEGDWLRVLTSDGTQGWCFSYNLRPFETDKYGQKIGNSDESSEENTETPLDTILLQTWYPESYKGMIDSGRIDPEKLITSYNFHLDEETKLLTFNMPKIKESWTYTGAVERNDGTYKLNDIPVVITIRRNNFIVVRYTGESGKPEDFNLVTVEADLDELVQEENQRRENEFAKLTEFCVSEPYRSASYGNLNLLPDHSFIWNNNKLLIPAVLSQTAKNTGTARIKYFTSKSLSVNYDGVLTFRFDGMEKEVNFLYKIEEGGLRLEDASSAVIKNNILMERGLSPLVLYFKIGE